MATVPFLTKSYFIGDIFIPNLSQIIPSKPNNSNVAELTDFIAIYEPKYLKLLLGEDLYDLFYAGIGATSPDAKWTALKTKLYPDYYKTPAAYYVYFFLRRFQSTVTTLNGEVQPSFENTTPVNQNFKMIYAWNRMVELSTEIQEWLEESAQVVSYPDFAIDEDILTCINQFGI
jgi:hypothetical protein